MPGLLCHLRPYPLPLWNWAIIAIPGLFTLAVIVFQPPHLVWLRLISSGLAGYYLYWFSSALHARTIYRTGSKLGIFRNATWALHPVRYVTGMTVAGLITLGVICLWFQFLFRI